MTCYLSWSCSNSCTICKPFLVDMVSAARDFAKTEGRVLFVIGGHSKNWKFNSSYDVLVNHVVATLCDLVKYRQQLGNGLDAMVTTGAGVYGSMTKGDSLHFGATSDNTQMLREFWEAAIQFLYFVFPIGNMRTLTFFTGTGVTPFTDLWPPEGHCIKQRFTDRSTRYTVWGDDDQVDRRSTSPCLRLTSGTARQASTRR